MRHDSDRRAAGAVRACALVGSAVVLGTAAHLSASGSMSLGALLAITLLLVVVTCVAVAAGMGLARRPGRWASRAEDAAAGAALVLGQVLVHWLGSGHESPGIPPTGGHGGHGVPDGVAATPAVAPAGHAGGPAMLAAHCAAALAVAVLLRWLEESLTRLAAVLRATARVLQRAVARLRPPGFHPATRVGDRRLRHRAAARPAVVLGVLGATVTRRGPPTPTALA